MGAIVRGLSNFASSWDVISWINGVFALNPGQFYFVKCSWGHNLNFVDKGNTRNPRTLLMIPRYFLYSVLNNGEHACALSLCGQSSIDILFFFLSV